MVFSAHCAVKGRTTDNSKRDFQRQYILKCNTGKGTLQHFDIGKLLEQAQSIDSLTEAT